MRISRKFTQLAIVWLALIMFSSIAAAQADTSYKKTIRPEVQVGNISFNGPVYLDSLKHQDKIIMVNSRTSTREELSGYKILAYDFTILTASEPKKMSIIGNSLTGVKDLLNEAVPGAYVMISNIRCQVPKGEIVYLDNLAAVLK